MSLIRIIKQQLGLSVTPANNFTLDASADNGTMKLARGNAGATTQDIMTVDAAGNVGFPVSNTSADAICTSIKQADGTLIQFAPDIDQGNLAAQTAGSNTVSFPVAFVGAYAVTLTNLSGTPAFPVSVEKLSQSQVRTWAFNTNSVSSAQVITSLIAIGRWR